MGVSSLSDSQKFRERKKVGLPTLSPLIILGTWDRTTIPTVANQITKNPVDYQHPFLPSPYGSEDNVKTFQSVPGVGGAGITREFCSKLFAPNIPS